MNVEVNVKDRVLKPVSDVFAPWSIRRKCPAISSPAAVAR